MRGRDAGHASAVPTSATPTPPRKLRAQLRLRVWLAETFRPTELQQTLFWAGVIGFTGACSSILFRSATALVHRLMTRQNGGGFVESFMHLPTWERLALPAVGGVLAGLALSLGLRWHRAKSSTDYMEAIVLGDGILSARSSLVKSLSALFSIASGASIGREGPLVQLSAMIASWIGRMRKTPTLKLRLYVACGAAAGIAAAYNAPIGGALFVAEIVLQSMAMETFGPLVFASVIATLTVRQFLGAHSLYEIPAVSISSNWEMLPHLLLGLLAGLLAPWFLRLLRTSERMFSSLSLPPALRLGLGGLIVGALAMQHPEVCGNGYGVVNQVLRGDILREDLLVILVLKLVATAATFGSGAVGGVFTPTLMVGACLGSLYGQGVQAIWLGSPISAEAFAIVGMGALLAATTHAPIMAIIMLFELTMDYQIILPLMLACVVGHYTCLAFEPKSIYADSLKRKGGGLFRQQLEGLRVSAFMKPDPVSIYENASFREIAESFITHRFNYIYVTDEQGSFRGVISLHDIKSYLNDAGLAELVLARDIVHAETSSITPEASLTDALECFIHHEGERIPVIRGDSTGKLVGSLSKTDVILALAERSKPE